MRWCVLLTRAFRVLSLSQVPMPSVTACPADVGPVDLVLVALKAWQLTDLDLTPLARPYSSALRLRRHAAAWELC